MKKTLSILLTYGVLLAGALFMLAPFVLSVMTSFKTEAELAINGPTAVPTAPHWDNYVALFTERDFLVPLAVTIQVVFVITVGQLFSSVLAAYAFARLKFPGRDTIFWLYISTMMIPAIVTMIPLFTAVSTLGWRNSFLGLVAPLVFGSPYAMFLLRENFRSVPQEILDAATLDGAGFFRQLRSIVLPMSRPILATLLLITVVSQWNNYMWPSIAAPRAEWNVLTVATAALQTQYTSNWTLVMAATTISIAPLIVLFLAFNNQIIRSIGVSGLK